MKIYLFFDGQDGTKGIPVEFDIKDVFDKIQSVYPHPIHQVSVNTSAVFPDANNRSHAYYYIQLITEDGEVVTAGLSDRRFATGRNIYKKE